MGVCIRMSYEVVERAVVDGAIAPVGFYHKHLVGSLGIYMVVFNVMDV